MIVKKSCIFTNRDIPVVPFWAILLFGCLSLAACNQADKNNIDSPHSATESSALAVMPTISNTLPTNLTPTPRQYQYVTLGSPFPADCGDGVARIWSNDSFNGPFNPNGIDDNHGHVDIFLPIGCDAGANVGEIVAPLNGNLKPYPDGTGFHLYLPEDELIDGVVAALEFSGVVDPSLDQINGIWINFGHMEGYSTDEIFVTKGQSIGEIIPFGDQQKLAYIISVDYDGTEFMFSPTLFFQDGPEWVCVQGSPYDCYPEPNDYATSDLSVVTEARRSTLSPSIAQVLGRIFPEGYDSAGVSANINTGNPDSRITHFDVAIPPECRSNPASCPVISPVDGVVWETYGLGDPKGTGGYVVAINLTTPPEGINNVLEEFDINPFDVYEYSIHLGHLVGFTEGLEPGMKVSKGMVLAEGVNYEPEPKVAYVLYIKTNQIWLQVSPCSVENTAGFCGVCYQYRGECPETNINYPSGGIEWWNENDPFWNSHELASP